MRCLLLLLGAVHLSVPMLARAEALTSKVAREEVLKSVEDHYPLIRAALSDQLKAENDLLSAQGGFDPILTSNSRFTPTGEYQYQVIDTRLTQPTPFWGASLYAGHRLGLGNLPSYMGGDSTNSSGEVRFGLEVPLLQNGPMDRRRAAIGIQTQVFEQAKTQTDLQRIDARRLAEIRFYELMAASERWTIAKDMLQLAEDRDRITHLRVGRGDAAKIERTDNLRNLVQRRAALISSQRAFEKASLELSLFLRDDQGQPRVLDETACAPLQDVAEIPGSSVRTFEERNPLHPEVVRLELLLEQNRFEQNLMSALALPRLNSYAEISQDTGVGSATRSAMEWKIGWQLEWPILLRSARGQLQAVRAQGQRIDAQRELTTQRIDVGLKDQSQALQAARLRAHEASEEIRLALEVEQAEKLRLKHGDSNILFVNLRELATAEARSRWVDAKLDYYRALAELEALSARTGGAS